MRWCASIKPTCAEVIQHFDGHIAQYLGDGLLVYFGYPRAHEDDAQRAVRAGLGMIEAMGQLKSPSRTGGGVPLAVRLGIHTGLVVVGAYRDRRTARIAWPSGIRPMLRPPPGFGGARYSRRQCGNLAPGAGLLCR